MKVNFRIGSDMAIILNQIATEKILYDFEPEKSIETFTESLGCTREQAIEFIRGDKYVLEVDPEEGTIYAVSRDEVSENHPYPIFEGDQIAKEWLKTLLEDQDLLMRALYTNFKDYTTCSRYHFAPDNIEMDIDDAIDIFLNDKKEDVKNSILDKVSNWLDEFYDTNVEVYNAVRCIGLAKAWLEECNKKIYTIDWMIKNHLIQEPTMPDWNDYNDRDDYWKALESYKDIPMVMKAYAALQDRLRMAFEMCRTDGVDLPTDIEEYFKQHDAVIDRFKDIMVPDDIHSKHDAGYLDPNGNYYALDGHISTMLHCQIEDALVKHGIIKYDDKFTSIGAQLEYEGWVKLHNQWVMFEPEARYIWDHTGSLNHLTEAQVNAIIEYGNTHYDGILKFGILHTPVYMGTFRQMDNLMRTKLFEIA